MGLLVLSLFGCNGGDSQTGSFTFLDTSQATGQDDGTVTGDDTGGGDLPLVQPSLVFGAANFVDISSTGQGRRLGDDEVVSVPLGFTLRGFGQSFDAVNVSSNGILTFGEGNNSFLNVPLPSQLAPGGTLAVLWGDWGPPATGNWVFTETRGEAPNRQFIVQWNGAESPLAPGNGITFEAILNEAGGGSFQYLDTDLGLPVLDGGAAATVGAQDPSRTLGVVFTDRPINSNTGITVTY